MKSPPGIAKFDSATAMAQSLARLFDGRDFPGLGQSRLLQAMTRRGDLLPRRLRERVFARVGAQEGVPPDEIETVSTPAVAAWLAGLQRTYPAVMIGSANGALVHLCAAVLREWRRSD